MELNKSLKFKIAHMITKAMNSKDYKTQFTINLKYVFNNTIVDILRTLFNLLPFSENEKLRKCVKAWNEEHTRTFLSRFDKLHIYYNDIYENLEFIKKYENNYFMGKCSVETFIFKFFEMNKKFNNYGIALLLTVDDMYNKRYTLDKIKEEYKMMTY